MTAVRDELPRVSSGAQGLDVLVGGGLLRGGTYIVAGPPGAGKTILGNQFCYSAVARGESALYVTALSETHGRMLLHLQPMRFYDPTAVGKSVFYLSGYDTLKKEGLGGLARLLFRLVREHKARALVLDGLTAVEELAESKLAFREFLYQLGAHNTVAGCTTMLLTTQSNKGSDPEFAMVDGIIALSADLIGLKATRGIEVMKFRGSRQLGGKHTFDISNEGVEVFPRTEALYVEQPRLDPDPTRRLAFGVRELDEMTEGGLVSRSSTLIFGSPGAGKTLLGLSFLAQGATLGQPGLYYGFSETGRRLVERAEGVSIPMRKHTDSGLVRLESRIATETLPDRCVDELFTLVEQTGAKRLMIDGLEPFAKEAIDPERTTRFVVALTNELRSRDVTTMFTQQTNQLFGPEIYAPTTGVEAIVDNIIFLRFFELRSQLYRLCSILKMRDGAYDPALRQFHIDDDGIHIAETFESAEAILTGLARPAYPVTASAHPVQASPAARARATEKRSTKSETKKRAAKKKGARR